MLDMTLLHNQACQRWRHIGENMLKRIALNLEQALLFNKFELSMSTNVDFATCINFAEDPAE
jgi:hypothetical protein